MLCITLLCTKLFQMTQTFTIEAEVFIQKHSDLIDNCEETLTQYMNNVFPEKKLCTVPHQTVVQAKSIMKNFMTSIEKRHLVPKLIDLLLSHVTKLQKRDASIRNTFVTYFLKLAVVLIIAGGESGLIYYIRKSSRESDSVSIQMNNVNNEIIQADKKQKMHCLFFETCPKQDCETDNSCVDPKTGTCSTLSASIQTACNKMLEDCSVKQYLDWNSSDCVKFQTSTMDRLNTIYNQLCDKNVKIIKGNTGAIVASVIVGIVLVGVIAWVFK
eukprot:NODE_147_length_15617_cov_0.576750.p9 type:complete len:271 gc:universal NODE_147_length_15617_cov_0.576750:11515-10703(-)